MSAELAVRGALVAALRGDAALIGQVNAVYDGAPVQASAPYVVIEECAGVEWGGKGLDGCEVRLSIGLRDQGESSARLAAMGVEIHARSLFLQGLLLMAPDSVPDNLKAAAPHLAKLRARFAQAGTTVLAAALDFVLSRPEIAIALVGVTSRDELDDILASAQRPLPPLDWNACALDDQRLLTPSLWNRS